MHIPAFNNVYSLWLKHFISFCDRAVTNEDAKKCSFIQLISLDLWNMSETQTTKYFKEVQGWFIAIPHLFCKMTLVLAASAPELLR